MKNEYLCRKIREQIREQKNYRTMAKISIYLDGRRLKKDGTANVCARISNRNTTAFLTTGYSVPPDCWKNGRVVKGKSAALLRKSPSALNALIAEAIAQYEIAMREEIGLKSSLTAKNIRRLIITVSTEKCRQKAKECGFRRRWRCIPTTAWRKTG